MYIAINDDDMMNEETLSWGKNQNSVKNWCEELGLWVVS